MKENDAEDSSCLSFPVRVPAARLGRSVKEVFPNPGFRAAAYPLYARERNPRTRARRCARGQIALYPGRRIRSRRDGAHPRRRTRRPFRQTGHRDWIIESSPCRRKTSAAEERNHFEEGSPSGKTGLEAQQEPQKTVASTIPRRQAALEERTALRRLASCVVPSGPRRRAQTHQSRSLPRREESRRHPKEKETLRNHAERQTIRRRCERNEPPLISPKRPALPSARKAPRPRAGKRSDNRVSHPARTNAIIQLDPAFLSRHAKIGLPRLVSAYR
jgi:hypothetical protein